MSPLAAKKKKRWGGVFLLGRVSRRLRYKKKTRRRHRRARAHESWGENGTFTSTLLGGWEGEERREPHYLKGPQGGLMQKRMTMIENKGQESVSLLAKDKSDLGQDIGTGGVRRPSLSVHTGKGILEDGSTRALSAL